MRKQRELEAAQLEQELADGLITQQEFNAQVREMERDERDEQRERAEAAYRQVMEDGQ